VAESSEEGGIGTTFSVDRDTSHTMFLSDDKNAESSIASNNHSASESTVMDRSAVPVSVSMPASDVDMPSDSKKAASDVDMHSDNDQYGDSDDGNHGSVTLSVNIK
jgi:hypothetical protein